MFWGLSQGQGRDLNKCFQILFVAFLMDHIPSFGRSFAPPFHLEQAAFLQSPKAVGGQLQPEVSVTAARPYWEFTTGTKRWFGHINPRPGSLGHTNHFDPSHGWKWLSAKRYRQETNQPLSLLKAYWCYQTHSRKTKAPLPFVSPGFSLNPKK